MIGAADIANCMGENGEFDDLAGITPRAVSELFRLLNERTAQIDFVVRKLDIFPFWVLFSSTIVDNKINLVVPG